MADMLRDVSAGRAPAVNLDALRSEVRAALINQKANACPIAMRLAWHAAGTYDARDNTGGCNGATMRYAPESNDPDNAGLGIVRDLLLPVKLAHPELSYADLYAFAGACALEFLGGPKVVVLLGRTDDSDSSRCPAHGRLPDAKKGAKHLRQVFGRMGLGDREIVALSGAHTLGRAHATRSGFDGPWTTKPLRFDNEYYVNLLHRTWRLREWDGPLQFEDVESDGELMMLPSDLALVEDAAFKAIVQQYAEDEQLFFREFATAYAKLLALGCPPACDPARASAVREETVAQKRAALFREHAMHGSVHAARKLYTSKDSVDAAGLEATSGRTALHKAAFWGHTDMTRFLLNECKLNPNTQDCYGDSALHDAAKFGHEAVAELLLAAGARAGSKNSRGLTPADVARLHGKDKLAAKLSQAKL